MINIYDIVLQKVYVKVEYVIDVRGDNYSMSVENSVINFCRDVKKDFPIISENQDVVYMDSAATTLKPKCVIDAVCGFYRTYTANIFRGEHKFSEKAAISFENTRRLVSSYINARANEIIFTQNCTDAIYTLKKLLNLDKNDIVINSILEHHSNYLPWMEETNLLTVGIDDNGHIDIDEISKKINKNTKLLAMTYASNVTGNIQPVADIVKICREKNVLSLIDATQAVAHIPIDVKKIDCDFMVFSAHKMLGPSGVGVLYVKDEIMDSFTPFKLGGGMVNKVDSIGITFKEPPYCFESGTPAIENVIGFGSAIEYIMQLGIDNISSYSKWINQYATEKLRNLDFIYFPFYISENHVPVFTFLPKRASFDVNYISEFLSGRKKSIAVNAGYQCCQPLYSKYGIKSGAIRASLYIYNSKEDVDELVDALNDMKKFMV